MKNVLIATTGGTIACSPDSNGVLHPEGISEERLFSDVVKGAKYSIRTICSILSETLDGNALNLIVNSIVEEVRSNKYDGIIVTHGSDTIAYTSAALTYALGNECIPVVILCSDLPLTNPSATGHASLMCASRLISDTDARGVFAVYPSTSRTYVKVYRGNHLLRHVTFSDAFFSVDGPFGIFTESDGITVYDKPTETLFPHSFHLSEYCPVLFLDAYPGMRYPDIPAGIGAIFLGTYHSDTLNTTSPALEEFSRAAAIRGIPIYTTHNAKGNEYGSMTAYERLGIRLLPSNMSPIFALISLWAELSH